MKAEYHYFDLGDHRAAANDIPAFPPFQVRYRWETQPHTVNAGLNFKF